MTGSKAKPVSAEDLALAPAFVPDEMVDLIHQVKVVAAEATSSVPGLSSSVQAIADRTGLSVGRVREILAHPDYRAILSQALRDRCVSLLHEGVDAMASLVRDPEIKPMVKINAVRTITATYSAIAHGEKPHGRDVGEDAFGELLAAIDQVKKKKELALEQKLQRITVEPNP